MAGRRYTGLLVVSRTLVMLTNKGADVNAKDNAGKTPLALAVEKDKKEIAELLRKHGAKEE